MDSRIILKIDNHALLKVKHLIPDFCKYSLRKEFDELYNENIEFVQVRYFDRTVIENRYKSNEIVLFVSPENIELLKKDVERYNEALKKAQQESVNDLIQYDRSTYFYFSRVSVDIGLCHLNTYNRKKSREEEDKIREYKEHVERMEKDNQYRKEVEWFEEEDRPFGGAFSSWKEYYRYRG